MTALPLDGVHVVDLSTYVPGPYATQLLADLGAEVTHVEPPSGEPARHLAQRVGDDSALHWWLGRGKRSLFVDLKTAEGRGAVHTEVARADVVVEGFTPGVAARLDVDYGTCKRLRPELVYCSISGYGQDAPDADSPAHDLNIAARSGLLDQVRDASGDPVAVGPVLTDLVGGLHAAVGILAALRHRDRTGQGQYLDVSLLGAALAMMGSQLMKVLAGDTPTPTNDFNLGADPAYATYRTRDGAHLAVGALEPKFWQRLCRAIGRSDLVPARDTDPRAVRAELEQLFGSRSLQEWTELLEPVNACVSPVRRIEEVPDDPRVLSSRSLVPGSEDGGPTIRGPIRMSATPPRLTCPVAQRRSS